MINVTLIPIIPQNSNYAYILESDNGDIAVMDPGDAGPIIKQLEERHQKPDIILITHHHWDHVNGLDEMLKWHACPVAGPEKEKGEIPQITVTLNEESDFSFGGETFRIIETPGHTLGHIVYYAPESKLLFAGDTLFSMGCGRLFEGTAEHMWNSFQKLLSLPDDTKIFCGHEYTLANAEFCLNIEPDNEALKTRLKEVKELRTHNKPTIPSTIEREKRTNLFLRAESIADFAEIRRLKDAT